MSFLSLRFPASKALLWIAAGLFQYQAAAGDAAASARPPAAAAVPASASTNFDAVAESVVQIFATVREPDVYRPWTKHPAEESSGTGVVIKGKRILSNAHVVEYASRVEV
jgi:S1-C subfamily serine protease